jgi:hypothetical protein
MKLIDYLKPIVKRLPFLRKPAYALFNRLSGPFKGSAHYWESRYARGGHSGPGSFNRLATFKAEILNDFVNKNNITTVIEYGCGDGNQLELAQYPHYTGFDVSPRAIALCGEKFKTHSAMVFKPMNQYNNEQAQLTLSLDVIYHLVEDHVFDEYMRRLFASAQRFVIIYSSNSDQNPVDQPKHVRHRKFTDWVDGNAPNWKLQAHIPNKYPYNGKDETGSFADFFIYARENG